MEFLYAIYHRIKEFFADISAYLRFGLKNQIKSVFAWFSEEFYMIQLWWEALPASRHIRQHEAKQAMNELWNRLKYMPQAFINLLWTLVSSPREGMRQLSEAWHGVRTLSLKDILQGLWRSYVALLLTLIIAIEDLYHRWASLSVVARFVSAIAVVLILALGISSPWLIDEVKDIRASQLMTEAEILKEQKYDVKAYEKIRSAALLNPKNAQVLEQAMESAKTLKSAEALWWSEQMSKQQEFDADSMANVVDYAVDFNQMPTGVKYLSRLQAQYPDSPLIIDTELKILLSQGHINRALSRAREFLENGKETPLVHDIIIGLTNKNNPAQAEQIKQQLQDNLYRMDDIGLHLCEIVLAEDVPPNTEEIEYDYQAIWQHLLQHPDADRKHIALAVGRAYQSKQIEREDAVDSILAQYDLTDSDDRVLAYSALNFFRLGGVSDQLILNNDLKLNRNLCRQLLISLILSDRPDINRAKELLNFNKTDNALTEADKNFWSSFISLHEGDIENYTLQMLQALNKASPSDWANMETLVKFYTAIPQQLVFYRELYGLTNSSPYATRTYLEILYSLGATDELKTILKRTNLEPFQGDPQSMNFVIYLKCLFELDLEQCRYFGESQIVEFPEVYNGYITLAFAYFKSGYPDMAKAILNTVPMRYNPVDIPSYYRFAYVSVTGDLDYLPDAATAILPQEKIIYRLSTANKPIPTPIQ